jgi:predicted ribosome quality control (RQC) complex YloA/Tae2 family protein
VDGFAVLVGRGARENDELTFREAAGGDFWLHVAGATSGSHVVVRNPEGLAELPRPVAQRAAELAAWHSKARHARGKVEVHLCRVADVRKPRSFPAGKVEIRRWESLRVYARGAGDDDD